MGRTAWVLVLLGGCGVEPASACPGAAPALTECALGVYHADCGGDGAPAFACDEVTGACRWFTGGCVASGHRVSDCPIEDRCCHESADGPWAFESGWMPTGPSVNAPRTRLLADLEAVGSTLVDDRSPGDLAVTIDPVTGPDVPTITCEGDVGVFARLCAAPALLVAPPSSRPHDTFALEVRPSLYGPTLVLEVLDDSSLLGRVFPGYHNDGEGPGIPASCGTAYTGQLTGGTLRIDRLDPAAHGELVVHAVEGGTITVRF